MQLSKFFSSVATQAYSQRKQAMYQKYNSRIIPSSITLIFQHNNLSAYEWTQLRFKLKQTGDFNVSVLRSGVFRAALRGSKDKKVAEHAEAVFGPLAVVYGDVADEILGEGIKKLWSILNKQDKVLVTMGLVQGRVVDFTDLEKLKEIPAKSVLQSELVGLIGAHQRNLVRVLDRRSQDLVALLGQHQKNLEVNK